MTTFCEVVTGRDTVVERAPRRLATKEMGEAMASAPESPASGGNHSGADAAPLHRALIAMVLAASAVHCGDEPPTVAQPVTPAAVGRAAADPAHGITTELDGAAPVFAAAALAELTGDVDAARAGFERVLAAGDAPPSLAARAALRLAQIASRAGRRRHALDLVARASSLAPSDPAIAEGVAELQADVVAAAGTGDLRGPRLGTPLPGVAPAVAEAFAAAERALAQVHRIRPRPIIEALSTSIRVKEAATEEVVAKYRVIAERGGLAQTAASYRAGSLYHDLALGLLFELPPELDPTVAAGLRRTLRVRAVGYLKKAVVEYQASLSVSPLDGDELWRLAAETDLRSARDLLGEAGAK